MSDFYKTLSENSIYLRWGNRPDEAHVQDLKEACSPGKDKETTLIVRDKQNEVIGVGQLVQFTEEKKLFRLSPRKIWRPAERDIGGKD